MVAEASSNSIAKKTADAGGRASFETPATGAMQLRTFP
jgi:hypothetical protein